MERVRIFEVVSLIAILMAGIAGAYSYYLYTIIGNVNNEISGLQNELDLTTEVLELAGYDYLIDDLREKYDVIMGAREEGELLFYGTLGADQAAALMEAFMNKYPFIKAEYVRGSAYTILEKYMTEVSTGNVLCDVFSTSEPTPFLDLKIKGYLMQYDSPEYAHYPQTVYADPGYWCSYRVMPTVWSVNTDIVNPETIKTADDTTNPAFKGKIAIEDARVSGTGYISYYAMRVAYGVEYWEKIAELEPSFFPGTGPIVEKLSSGEIVIGPVVTYRLLDYKINKGAPIDGTLPDGKCVVTAVPVGIVSQVRHPNAAKLFFDFILSKEAQTLLVTDWYVDSIRDDVSPAFPGLNYAVLGHDIDWADCAAKREEYIEEFSEVFGLM